MCVCLRRGAEVNGRTQHDEGELVFLWESLGPNHHDRVRAVAQAGHRVKAVQLFKRSDVYEWETPDTALYEMIALSQSRQSISTGELARRIVDAAKNARAAFLCHYNEPAVYIAARRMKARGIPVFTMLDSKADDRRRNPITNWLKRLSMRPYAGAIVAGERSAEYARQLGIPEDAIASHYNALDIAALQRLTFQAEAVEFAGRPFLIVARLIPEKNLHVGLEAYSQYVTKGGKRRLSIIGEGPEEASLMATAERLGLTGYVDWLGARPRVEVAQAMHGALALLLPSTSETYGFVVIEALAQGLPVIVSERAGVVDLPIDNGVEGLVIDPANTSQLTQAMWKIDSGESAWIEFSNAALSAADRGDTRHFVRSVEQLAGLERR